MLCSSEQYSFWNQKHRRVELVVLEMYEGNRQSNSTAFSSFHPPPPPIVMRQAYIFPGHISAMATTVTEKGITNKELLCEWNLMRLHVDMPVSQCLLRPIDIPHIKMSYHAARRPHVDVWHDAAMEITR